MRIYKRGPSYWAQWRGRRFSLQTSDRKAADLEFARIQREAADPAYRPANAATLREALEAFVANRIQRRRAEGTVRQYGVHASHICRILGAETPLPAIEATQIDRYLETRDDEGASTQTQWKELCTLRGALRIARRRKQYPHALDVVMPEDFEGATSKPGTRALPLPDVARLVASLPDERAAVVAFIVAVGADWASVEAAQPGDVDVGLGTALVRGTKTATRWRTVPILRPFRALAKLAAEGLPFEPWQNVRRDLAVACRRAGVERVTPRDLRRSHGTILRALGVEPSLIAPMLGHADSRMVERIYGRLTPDALAALMRARTGTRKVRGARHAKADRRKPARKKPVRRSRFAD